MAGFPSKKNYFNFEMAQSVTGPTSEAEACTLSIDFDEGVDIHKDSVQVLLKEAGKFLEVRIKNEIKYFPKYCHMLQLKYQ